MLNKLNLALHPSSSSVSSTNKLPHPYSKQAPPLNTHWFKFQELMINNLGNGTELQASYMARIILTDRTDRMGFIVTLQWLSEMVSQMAQSQVLTSTEQVR